VGSAVSNETAGGVTDGVPGVRTYQGVSVPSKGCIVIVEPDDLIRELLERWLGEAGYQAVLVVKNHVLPMVKPRLVITDISDPGSAGNTIEALQAAYAAPILALSARFRRGLGGSSEPAQRLHVEKVLPKPFTRQQLLRAVRETLKQT
jgi:CheY-like chemotaxis protein